MFQESLFVKAIQGPSVILFDEVNAISNSNSFDFHALLQNRELFIKDANGGLGFTYKLHPECRIGFAQNPKSAKYIGGSIKPSNFLGRCTFLTYPEFTEEDIKKLLGNKFPKIKKTDIAKFVKFYFASLKIIEHAQLPIDISIRQLINVVDLWNGGLELKDALNDGLICMLDAASQPAAKDAFVKASHAVWVELMPVLPLQMPVDETSQYNQASLASLTSAGMTPVMTTTQALAQLQQAVSVSLTGGTP
jgi:MoxR-like ATPase